MFIVASTNTRAPSTGLSGEIRSCDSEQTRAAVARAGSLRRASRHDEYPPLFPMTLLLVSAFLLCACTESMLGGNPRIFAGKLIEGSFGGTNAHPATKPRNTLLPGTLVLR